MIQAKHPADPTPPTLEGKLALLRKLRDRLGSGDMILRLVVDSHSRYFDAALDDQLVP